MTTPLAERRRDLHNTSINFDLAVAGRCGFTHIPSGRVCQLPYRPSERHDPKRNLHTLRGADMTNRTPTLRMAESRGVSDHLPDLRSALEQQRQFRTDQLDELAAELADPATAADLPRIQVAAAVRTAAAAALADIDAALQRIEHGGYGTCQQCDTAIPLERMEILPMSRLCMRCQHAAETRRPATTHRAVQGGGNNASPARHPSSAVRAAP
jgi:RNA polymerase-binding transcription factor DksA